MQEVEIKDVLKKIYIIIPKEVKKSSFTSELEMWQKIGTFQVVGDGSSVLIQECWSHLFINLARHRKFG